MLIKVYNKIHTLQPSKRKAMAQREKEKEHLAQSKFCCAIAKTEISFPSGSL